MKRGWWVLVCVIAALPPGCGSDTIDETTEPDSGPRDGGAVACTSSADCSSVPTPDACQRAVCGKAEVCVLEPIECQADDPCLVAVCDPGAGCQTAPGPLGDPCDDGDPCTQADACDAGQCAGTDVSCPAAPECSVAFCDSDADGCTTAPATQGTPCQEDGQPCTGTHTCDGSGACLQVVAAPDPCCTNDADCDDLAPCTADACDTSTGLCTNAGSDEPLLVWSLSFEDGEPEVEPAGDPGPSFWQTTDDVSGLGSGVPTELQPPGPVDGERYLYFGDLTTASVSYDNATTIDGDAGAGTITFPAGAVLIFDLWADLGPATGPVPSALEVHAREVGGGESTVLWKSADSFAGGTWGLWREVRVPVGALGAQTRELHFQIQYATPGVARIGTFVDDVRLEIACCTGDAACDDGTMCTTETCDLDTGGAGLCAYEDGGEAAVAAQAACSGPQGGCVAPYDPAPQADADPDAGDDAPDTCGFCQPAVSTTGVPWYHLALFDTWALDAPFELGPATPGLGIPTLSLTGDGAGAPWSALATGPSMPLDANTPYTVHVDAVADLEPGDTLHLELIDAADPGAPLDLGPMAGGATLAVPASPVARTVALSLRADMDGAGAESETVAVTSLLVTPSYCELPEDLGL